MKSKECYTQEAVNNCQLPCDLVLHTKYGILLQSIVRLLQNITITRLTKTIPFGTLDF
jgi:hypothetical protein